MLTKAPKGTKDIYGGNVFIWQYIEETIRSICKTYGYTEIRTPIFEHTELFLRSVGESSDIVQKEMYTFLDKGERSITLRPEGTACVARSFIENSMYANPQPTKLYYIGPYFRYEKPQDGRQRQFHQFGVEVFGAASPSADAEVISLAYELLERLGIKNAKICINSLGTASSRALYTDKLRQYIGSKSELICKLCKDRLLTNPLRVLDCKEAECQSAMKGAPECLDFLDDESAAHFEGLKQILTDMGIPFAVDPRIVRGLDYYTRTVFEIVSNDAGAQKTVCGGGRYDTMIKDFGGPEMPAFGFGLGLERLIMTLGANNIKAPVPEYFIGSIGEEGYRTAQSLVYKLRKKGVYAESDLLGRSVKAQLKYADKIGAKNSVIIGENEVASGKATIRNMETGEQTELQLSQLLAE